MSRSSRSYLYKMYLCLFMVITYYNEKNIWTKICLLFINIVLNEFRKLHDKNISKPVLLLPYGKIEDFCRWTVLNKHIG